MNDKTYTNIFISAVVLLQIFSVLMVVMAWKHEPFSVLSIPLACVGAIALSAFVLAVMMTIRKKVKSTSVNNDAGDLTAATGWIIIGSAIALVLGIGIVIADKGRGKFIGLVAAGLGVASFYAALAGMSALYSKKKN